MKQNKNQQSSLEKIFELIEKTNSSANSVNWWEREMEAILHKMDKLENSTKTKDKIELNKLTQKLATLIPRAKVEMEIIDKLESDLNKLSEGIINELLQMPNNIFIDKKPLNAKIINNKPYYINNKIKIKL